MSPLASAALARLLRAPGGLGSRLMARPPSTYGLRVTVRMHGVVVSQSVHWPRVGGLGGEVVVGQGLADAIPTPSGRGLVRLVWEGPSRARLEPVEETATPATLGPGQSWRWGNGAGVDVDLDLVPLQHARRLKDDMGGDAALLTMLLMLVLGVAQAQMLLQGVLVGGYQPVSYEPTPEMIARLLERDLDGADEGIAEEPPRTEHEAQAESYYLPAGNDGQLSRAGGGAEVGDRVERREATEGAPPSTDEPALAEASEDPQSLPGEQPDLASEGEPTPELAAAQRQELVEPPREYVPDPVERFVGWGFRDWFDVADARQHRDTQRMERILELARRRLRIDPDDPGALITLGHYAYLAEDHALTRSTYERFIERYPEDSAGYNNLALSYKRTGEYATEEALYRQALELDPFDVHVLNNLAVNLAHQERFEEAEEIMDLLAELDPEDPYAELHRAKVAAARGQKARAYRHLEEALTRMASLDTLHHIEFRQDIRVDPVFSDMRDDRRFARLLREYYGDDAEYLLSSADGEPAGGRRGTSTPWGSRG